MDKQMPTRQEFDEAAKRLADMGFLHGCSVMADDAHKEGVTNFGQLFYRGDEEFWLNYKTINDLPMPDARHLRCAAREIAAASANNLAQALRSHKRILRSLAYVLPAKDMAACLKVDGFEIKL